MRYYLISILFILFDLEVAFPVPWATIFGEIVSTDSVKVFGFSRCWFLLSFWSLVTLMPGPRVRWIGE